MISLIKLIFLLIVIVDVYIGIMMSKVINFIFLGFCFKFIVILFLRFNIFIFFESKIVIIKFIILIIEINLKFN